MTFQHQDSVARNPHIRDVRIILFRTIDEDDNDYPESVDFRINIYDQTGHRMAGRSGDLVPHLTAGQITALQSFMDAMWTKAETEIIGT